MGQDIFGQQPAMRPPPGITPNFKDPPNLAGPSIAMITCAFLLIILAVGSRIYTKAVIIRKLVLEDYILLSVFVVYAIAYNTLAIIMIRLPIAVHQWNVTITLMKRERYIFNISMILYGIIIAHIKISIILEYLRVFVATRNALYWLLHSLIWLHFAFYTSFALLEIIMCTRRSKQCGPNISGHCFDCLTLNSWAAGVNAASDLLLVVIPQVVIWKLRMKIKKKWGLSAIFLIGIFASAAAATRFYYCSEIRRTGDYTYAASMMGIWSCPEITCGFLVICLPVLPKFLKHLGNKPFASKMNGAFRRLIRRNPIPKAQETGDGPNDDQHKEPGANVMISDIEFHELMQRTGDAEIDTLNSSRTGGDDVV